MHSKRKWWDLMWRGQRCTHVGTATSAKPAFDACDHAGAAMIIKEGTDFEPTNSTDDDRDPCDDGRRAGGGRQCPCTRYSSGTADDGTGTRCDSGCPGVRLVRSGDQLTVQHRALRRRRTPGIQSLGHQGRFALCRQPADRPRCVGAVGRERLGIQRERPLRLHRRVDRAAFVDEQLVRWTDYSATANEKLFDAAMQYVCPELGHQRQNEWDFHVPASFTATTTVPAPTTTSPAPTTTVPAPTTTVPAPTTIVPASSTTVAGGTARVDRADQHGRWDGRIHLRRHHLDRG